MKGSSLAQLFAIASIVTLLTGCGGGGSSTSGVVEQNRVSPAVTVDWPERTRNFQAPSSALSVKFVLHPLDSGGSDISFVGTRNDDVSAHTENYRPSSSPAFGTYSIDATFYANPDTSGTVVGTASSQVEIGSAGMTNADGTQIGAIDFDSPVAGVTLTIDPSIREGRTLPIRAGACDASGNMLVVSEGSFTYTVVEGEDYLAVTDEGYMTGVRAGSATLRVSVDGHSAQKNIAVTASRFDE